MENLTKKEIAETLRQVVDGADVFAYGLARALRAVEAYDYELVDIVEAQGDYPAEGQLPYFGAITTDIGKQFIEDYGDSA